MEEFNTMQPDIVDETVVDEIVDSFNSESDEEISKIIAGMTAIINGNEKSYEWMKNQRWFERIWYDITRKNKATVDNMKAQRENLTKYTIKILVKMNELLDKHSNCIHDLYIALAVICHGMNNLTDEVSNLAVKLNEKIMSVDNYNYIITDIQNKKYNIDTPLISLIDIMSQIDGRIANDARKLTQLKETMENAGFEFSKDVDIATFSEEILNLPKDRIGRILLFCQNFSSTSRFIAYTCYLMENYYYLGESDKRIVKENGEALNMARIYSNLNESAHCVVGDLFTDIENALPDKNALPGIVGKIGVGNADEKLLTSTNYYDTKTFKTNDIADTKRVATSSIIDTKTVATSSIIDTKTVETNNIIVAGNTGSGKSTLINSVFGWKIAATGLGSPVTINATEYYNKEENIHFWEMPGFRIDVNSEHNNNICSVIKSQIEKSKNTIVWYCVDASFSRYEDCFVKKIYSMGVPIVIVVTKSKDDDCEFSEAIKTQNARNGISNIPVIPVLAEKIFIRDDVFIPEFGIKDLIDTSVNIIGS